MKGKQAKAEEHVIVSELPRRYLRSKHNNNLQLKGQMFNSAGRDQIQSGGLDDCFTRVLFLLSLLLSNSTNGEKLFKKQKISSKQSL